MYRLIKDTNFYEGDPVIAIINGTRYFGTIVEITTSKYSPNYPVLVKFKDLDYSRSYTIKGQLYTNDPQTLFKYYTCTWKDVLKMKLQPIIKLYNKIFPKYPEVVVTPPQHNQNKFKIQIHNQTQIKI